VKAERRHIILIVYDQAQPSGIDDAERWGNLLSEHDSPEEDADENSNGFHVRKSISTHQRMKILLNRLTALTALTAICKLFCFYSFILSQKKR